MPNRPLIFRASTLVRGLVLYVDGYPGRVHRLVTRTGGQPVEDGRRITDHAVAEPRSLVLTGSVSDMGGIQRPKEAWAAIEDLHQREEPVRVVTEWRTYPEMLIKRCEGTATGRGLRFEMEVEEVIRVSTTEEPSVPSTALSGSARDRSGETARGRVPLGPSVIYNQAL